MNETAAIFASDYAVLAAVNIGVFVSAILVIMMQPGFMLLEAGSVSRKNAINNIFKNMIDFCVGGLVFWAVGFSVFSGEGPVIDLLGSLGLTKDPGPAGPATLSPADTLFFLFQLGFASAAVTVSSGAVTARISPYAYLLFAGMFTGVIYPVVGFLVWHPAGVLYGEFTDFAGAVVVHSTGAAAGLAGAVLLRPRIGFNGYDPVGLGQEQLLRIAASHAPHNTPIAALGVFLLWIGWFGFNGGTLLAAGAPSGVLNEGVDPIGALPGLMDGFGVVLVNTALAPCAAVLTLMAFQTLLGEDLNFQDLLNSVIAGLVAVTAAADVLSTPMALVAGAAAALVYRATRFALAAFSIDDPVGAMPAHGLTGVLGAAMVASAAPEGWLGVAISQTAYALAIFVGVFLASAIAFVLAAWACRLGYLISGRIGLRDAFRGEFLRVDFETEIYGLDESLHGQDAYNFRSLS
ncbi:MAG: hypothetical protein AAGM38_11985 [Pseudomonadota bacterium]